MKPHNAALLIIGLALLGAGLMMSRSVVATLVVGGVLAVVAMGGDSKDTR